MAVVLLVGTSIDNSDSEAMVQSQGIKTDDVRPFDRPSPTHFSSMSSKYSRLAGLPGREMSRDVIDLIDEYCIKVESGGLVCRLSIGLMKGATGIANIQLILRLKASSFLISY